MSGATRLLLGHVSGVLGIQGWMKLRSHTRPADAIFDYRPWRFVLRGEERALAVAEWRWQGRALVFRVDGVVDRNQAEALIGGEIWIDRASLPPAAPGEYYWADLEGLRVVTVDGVELGRVSHLLETGANDVMVVQGERERLLPFTVGHHVVEVDIAGGRIVVDWDPEF
ncbi:MAG: ribosome maturation factor RimM [Lysobacteraceae bacterium]